MSDSAIIPFESAAIMPMVSAEVMLKRYATIIEIKDVVMKPGVHYGLIPGAGDKPTLLKPGAETLCTAFALYPDFEELERPDLAALFAMGDLTAVPFFQYRYRCTLKSRDGQFTVGSGIGSCNSWEKKYRYRSAELVCPVCGKATVFKSKRENEGWFCWRKKDGCGEQFPITDSRIADQKPGKVPNPDIAELINTIDKMAQKRALIAATLIAVGASDFFTQDLEHLPQYGVDDDEVIPGEVEDVTPPRKAVPKAAAPTGESTAVTQPAYKFRPTKFLDELSSEEMQDFVARSSKALAEPIDAFRERAHRVFQVEHISDVHRTVTEAWPLLVAGVAVDDDAPEDMEVEPAEDVEIVPTWTNDSKQAFWAEVNRLNVKTTVLWSLAAVSNPAEFFLKYDPATAHALLDSIPTKAAA